jgi:hypothetical protein
MEWTRCGNGDWCVTNMTLSKKFCVVYQAFRDLEIARLINRGLRDN